MTDTTTDIAASGAAPRSDDAMLHHDASDARPGWVDIASSADIAIDRGVAALVDGEPVAVFRLVANPGGDEQWFAVDHTDPISGALVIARGLVGSTDIDGVEVMTVASPIHKERYNLATGERLDGAGPALHVWEIVERAGRVLVRRTP